jgi:hypothetical protein
MDKTFLELIDNIEDEIDGAFGYAMLYKLHYKDHPGMAEMYKQLSMVELQHVDKLKECTHNYLSSYKTNDERPLMKMKTIMEYVFERVMKQAEEIRSHLR